MRMSRRMGQYGGKRSVVVSVYGAPNEDITLVSSNGKTYSGITLNAYGKSTQTYELPVGSYVIKGSTSVEVYTYGREIKVTKDTTVITAYPPGAIFWFGNGDTSGDSLYVDAYSLVRGNLPSTATKTNSFSGEYTQTNDTDYTVGLKAEVPSSAGSYYCGTRYSPEYQLEGYDYVNFYASCSDVSRFGFGFPATKPSVPSAGNSATKWDASTMYVTPTTTNYKLYSMEVTRTSGFFAMSHFDHKGGTYSCSVKAIWRDTTNQIPQGTIYESTVSVPMDATYRYCSAISGGFKTGYDLSYVGQGTDDYNAMMVPVPAFSFTGTGLRLKMAINCWSPYDDGYTYRWAVTTSRANEELYKGYGAVTDANQIMTGTFTPAYNSGSFGYQTFTLDGGEVPADTPLYIYLWRNVTTYGNIHVQGNVNITLQYLVE